MRLDNRNKNWLLCVGGGGRNVPFRISEFLLISCIRGGGEGVVISREANSEDMGIQTPNYQLVFGMLTKCQQLW